MSVKLTSLIQIENQKRDADRRAYAAMLEAGASDKPLPDNAAEILAARGTSGEQFRGEIAAWKAKKAIGRLDASAARLAEVASDARKCLARRAGELEATLKTLEMVFHGMASSGKIHVENLREYAAAVESDAEVARKTGCQHENKLAEIMARLRSAKGEQQRIISDSLEKLASQSLSVDPPAAHTTPEPVDLYAVMLDTIVGELRKAVGADKQAEIFGRLSEAFSNAAKVSEGT